MGFLQEKHGAIIVEIVDLPRATLKEAVEFRKILYQDIELGWKKIIVDLSECEFIDSTFLGTLVISLKRITGLGGELRLIGFQPPVHEMFQLTRMNNIFNTSVTREEAIKGLE
ncbi:MAG: STAS domain-containing protein [Ignavibacteriaceae bacterium]|nr:STAS domain-containing protein [Ignavibacteriaceae bacterium]